MNKSNPNLIDNTILTTPKPCASSTERRKAFLHAIDKKYGRRLTNPNSLPEENESDNSLGIIYDINNKDDLLSSRIDDGDINSHLQKQRQLAEHTLEKSRVGLPAKFLVPSDTPRYTCKKSYNNSSTVNESDLISQESNIRSSIDLETFNPSDISTPKGSNASNCGLKQCGWTSFQDINGITQKLRNSDVSVKDVCTELNRFSMGNLSRQSGVTDVDSGMFTPAELMADKFLRDEMSWRKEKGIPKNTKDNSSLSSLDPSESYSQKYSVGGFFQGKSDNVDNVFFKNSPEKQDPIPLVELTNTSEFEASETRQTEDSNINISQIAQLISEYGSEDTQKILSWLVNKSHSPKDETNSTVTSERDVDEYISANQMQNKYLTSNYPVSNVQQSSAVTSMKNLPSVRLSSTLRESNDRVRRTANINDFHESPDTLRNASSSTKTSLSSNYSNIIGKKMNKVSSVPKSSNFLNVRTHPVNSPSEDKENLSEGNRSLTSIRSVSSLDTLPDGKSPIKSNRLELIWGCLKSGRFSTQEFLIKSQLNQKIRMQASISGSSFRIAKDSHDSEMLTSTSFVLRPSETKSFAIMFCPTTIGAASEKINFYPILGGEVCYSKRQMLALFGYGGHANCDIANVAKDSTGKLWLSVGKIGCQTYAEENFTVKNNGTLFAFACLDVRCKGPFNFSNLMIEPNEFIIKPQEEISVTVRYSPSKRDLQYFLKKDVVEIGHINVLMGAEVTRGRLRRLYTKLKQQNTPIDPLIERLSKIFPGERMPSDLKYLKESVSAVKDLLQQLTYKEITVTLEQDLESTLVNPIADIEETTIYQTLYQDLSSTQLLDATTIRRDNPVEFSVEPTTIILTLPMKQEDTFLLHSLSSQRMPFEIKTEPDNVFSTYPSKGHISPYETMPVKITCHAHNLSVSFKDMGRVLVYVGDDVIEIAVKIVLIKSK